MMEYTVKLEKTEEGYAVWCPGLPECWSQGATENEALENIKHAIKTYLATTGNLPKSVLCPKGQAKIRGQGYN